MTKGRRGRNTGSWRSDVDEFSGHSERAPEGRAVKAPPGQRKRRSSGKTGSGLAYMVVPAIIVVALGAGFFWFSGSQNAGGSGSPAQSSQEASVLSDVAWPVYVARGPSAVKESYQFAVLRPDVLKYMPCYCGCGQHNGHRSNEDCFIAAMNEGGRTIAFEQHGST